MMKRKGWILFLALLLPGCVFVFLKIFGKNKFEVKPLYQEGSIEHAVNCPTLQVPYYVPIEALEEFTIPKSNEIELFVFSFVEDQAQVATIQKQLSRVHTEVKDGRTEFIMIRKDSLVINYNELKECILLTPNPNNIVLLDKQARIRGHYNAFNRDDVDRLIAEMQIILEP